MKFPTLFVNHGGGPLPLLGDPGHAGLVKFLSGVRHTLPPPKSILVVTAHWEERKPTVSSSPKPGMLYDYYGFPPESYKLKYPAPGSPELASKVVSLLKNAGIDAEEDSQRAFDHGTFVPLMLMYPDADVPVVQLSLMSSLDPSQHIAIGRALEPLREEGVLMVGSGLSYHNLGKLMGSLRGGGLSAPLPDSKAFDAWLQEAVTKGQGEEVWAKLSKWTHAPSARQAHPREEHLLPLMVVAGAAGDDKGRINFNEVFMGAKTSGFVFGDSAIDAPQKSEL